MRGAIQLKMIGWELIQNSNIICIFSRKLNNFSSTSTNTVPAILATGYPACIISHMTSLQGSLPLGGLHPGGSASRGYLPPGTREKWAVRILLECFLVINVCVCVCVCVGVCVISGK